MNTRVGRSCVFAMLTVLCLLSAGQRGDEPSGVFGSPVECRCDEKRCWSPGLRRPRYQLADSTSRWWCPLRVRALERTILGGPMSKASRWRWRFQSKAIAANLHRHGPPRTAAVAPSPILLDGVWPNEKIARPPCDRELVAGARRTTAADFRTPRVRAEYLRQRRPHETNRRSGRVPPRAGDQRAIIALLAPTPDRRLHSTRVTAAVNGKRFDCSDLESEGYNHVFPTYNMG